MKNQKGITLIALVITIIVLLILAGVSIAMLTGDNGILTKATQSKSETGLAEVLERVNMELNAQLANAMAGDAFDEKSDIEENLETITGDYDVEATVTNGTTYNTNATVTIKITKKPSNVTLTPNDAIGKVQYNATDKVWEVIPLEGSVTTE